MRFSFLTLLSLVCLGLLLWGCPRPGAAPPPTDDDLADVEEPSPQEVIEEMQLAAAYVAEGIDTVEAVITSFSVPQCLACIASEAGTGAVLQFQHNAPAIIEAINNAEAGEPVILEVAPEPVDITRCLDMEGKSEPWPLVDIDTTWRAVITWSVGLVTSGLVDLLEPRLPGPDAGDAYIASRFGLALLEQAGAGGVAFALDVITGQPTTEIPGFRMTWQPSSLDAPPMSLKSISGCQGDSQRAVSMCELEAATAFLR